MIQRPDDDFRGVGLLVYFFVYSVVVNAVGIILTIKLESEFLGSLVGGCVLGELCMFAIWATIGPNKFWIRWPMAFFMIVIGANLLILSIAMSMDQNIARDLEEAFRFNFAIPLVLLATQAPIWLGRIVLGWRIRLADGATLEKERRFGILEILLVMSYFGGALALARFTMDEGNGPDGLVIAFMLSVYGGMWMLMFAIPLMMGVLLPTHTRGTVAVLISYFSFMLLLPLAAIWFLAGAFSAGAVGGLLLFLGGNAMTFVVFALVLKAFGYALEIRLGQTSNIPDSPFKATGESPFANPWETPGENYESAGFDNMDPSGSTD